MSTSLPAPAKSIPRQMLFLHPDLMPFVSYQLVVASMFHQVGFAVLDYKISRLTESHDIWLIGLKAGHWKLKVRDIENSLRSRQEKQETKLTTTSQQIVERPRVKRERWICRFNRRLAIFSKRNFNQGPWGGQLTHILLKNAEPCKSMTLTKHTNLAVLRFKVSNLAVSAPSWSEILRWCASTTLQRASEQQWRLESLLAYQGFKGSIQWSKVY